MGDKLMKDELLKKLQRAYDDVVKIDEQRKHCNDIRNRITANENARLITISKNRTIGVAAGIAVAIMVAVIFPYGLYNNMLDAGAPKLFYFSPLIAMVVPGAIFGIMVTKFLKKNLAVFDEKKIEIENELAEAERILDNMAIVCKNTHSFIQTKFLNTTHLKQLYDILAYGRADDWKEALNVFEQDLHNQKIEANSKHAAICQEQALAAAKNAAFQAQRAADMLEWQNFWSSH